jgi:CheY-like chemotaxis protein
MKLHHTVRTKFRILYVEDEVVTRQTVKRIFERDGIEVRTATDGYEGVVLARKWQPDLILMDLIMPVMDGLEAIKALRADERTCDIPIIAYSSSTAETVLPKVLKAGVDSFLPKSAPQRDLIATVRERLRIAA